MEHNPRPPKDPLTVESLADSKAGQSSNMKLWLLTGIVILTLLVVLLVLPNMVTAPQPSITPPEQASVSEKPPGLSETIQLRNDAEQALQQFLRLQAQPGLRNAEIWASEDWSDAMSTAARGDEDFGQGRFSPAHQAYVDAGIQLQSILDHRTQTLQKYLETGSRHLQGDEVKEAGLAFGLVLAMQPDHQQALLGQERAAVRLQVLNLVTSAGQAEVSDNLQLAAQTYTSALQLDPLYAPAQDAFEKVTAVLLNHAFQDSMGRALEAIENGEFAVAEKALQEAGRIKPGNPAINDAGERLSSARRQSGLERLRKQANQMVKKEDWTAATETYRRALKIDSQAAFARNGLTKAQEKQQLHKQLDHYLADTARLYSDEPLDNARKLLAANQKTSNGEPLLAGKLEDLQQAVTLAVIPVDLIILSDNLTQVTIYKVGRLGSFETKQLSLPPGKYTVTGSRQGYRDVLKVIELKPGQKGQTLKINTEEQI